MRAPSTHLVLLKERLGRSVSKNARALQMPLDRARRREVQGRAAVSVQNHGELGLISQQNLAGDGDNRVGDRLSGRHRPQTQKSWLVTRLFDRAAAALVWCERAMHRARSELDQGAYL